MNPDFRNRTKTLRMDTRTDTNIRVRSLAVEFATPASNWRPPAHTKLCIELWSRIPTPRAHM